MSRDKPSFNVSLINIDMEWASKLIEVISKGVGSLSAQFVANQITKAKKYEIKEIAQAIAEANNLPVKASYDDGNINILPKDDSINPSLHPEFRAAEFMIRRESQRLASVEKASLYAAEELKKFSKEGGKISKEKINDSWVAKYFDEVGNLREEKALKYWGKLLAGEIKQPGSYSTRTLNLLGNTTKEEAELIRHALNHVILVSNPKIENYKYRDNFGFIYFKIKPEGYKKPVLTHYNSEILSSIGIIGASDSSVMLLKNGKREHLFYCGDYALRISRNKSDNLDKKIRSGKVRLLTTIGLELLGLHQSKVNENYLISIASQESRKNLNSSLYQGIYFEKKRIKFKKTIKEFKQD